MSMNTEPDVKIGVTRRALAATPKLGKRREDIIG